MPNPNFSDLDEDRRADAKVVKTDRRATPAGFNQRTANWPGVPEKTQPRDRSGGVKKLKIHPTSEGL